MARSKESARKPKTKKSALPESSEPALDLPPPKKSKESKRVTRELAAEAALANPTPAADAPADDGAAPAEGEKESKKKRKAASAVQGEGEEAAATEAPKGKKAKKAKAPEASKKPEPAPLPLVKIKKRKPTDPYTLEELPVQAQRAIQYAQTLGSPTFKFNKGRQNWLMRNIYSASEVPEEFVEDVLRYLRSVMGGSRDVLVKAAREILAQTIPTPAAPAAAAEGADAPVEALKVEAATGDDDDAEVEETEEQKQVRLLTTGKERAERMLKSLGVSLS